MRREFIDKMNRLGGSKTPFLFVISFDGEEGEVTPTNEIDGSKISFHLGDYTNLNRDQLTPLADKKSRSLQKSPPTYQRYREAFQSALNEIGDGNSYLLNLTLPTKITTPLSLEEIFRRSRAKYRLLYRDKFTIFSPETFIKISNSTISSYPMKGTIDASIKGAREIILSSKKERAEHYTIVDLIRNDLSRVASNVRVERDRYTENITTNSGELIQVSSEIVGDLPENYCSNIGTILDTLLPAGSITGAPKRKTVDIIEEIEKYERGFYTGVAGYFDGKDVDSCVMIRYIEQEEDKMIFKSGGGITSMSDLESEYRELIDKVYLPF